MSAPVRVQRKRTAGWRMPENTVYVGRPTPWGNPFVPGKPGGAYTAKVKDLRHAYLLYKSIAFDNEKLCTAAREHLRGKNLACWCPKDDPYEDCCHAAVLLEIANGPHPYAARGMSGKALTQAEWDEAKADAEVARIMAMSDEEILAEARAEGIDPEVNAAKCQAMVERILGRKPQ